MDRGSAVHIDDLLRGVILKLCQLPDKPLARCYVTDLKDKIERGQALKKRDRTKLRLMLAAAEILRDGGYHALRIADITFRARVARGSFYSYFEDKSDIALQVLSDFRKTMLSMRNLRFSDETWAVRTFLTHLYFAELNQLNSGLLRAFDQYVDEAEDFRKMRHADENILGERLYRAYCLEFGEPATEAECDKIKRKLHAMRLMTEKLCTTVYIEPMDQMAALFPTPLHVARVATDLWIAAFAEGESKRELKSAINLLKDRSLAK